MSILTQKLANASKQFQSHNFKKALELYEDCLNFCQKTDESPNIISNIMSSKGALQCILGQYDDALVTLNTVIKKDPTHFLCLMRRSQVYKKKNMLKKALKDLEAIHIFCPDNFQVSALKVQIQNLILKNKQNVSSDQSEQDESVDEAESLNFTNLKQIDRKSVTLSVNSSTKPRKSRVTILGDSTIEYNRTQPEDNGENQVQDFLLSHAQTHKKYLQTERQIEIDNQMENEAEPTGNLLTVPTIKVNRGNKKSILKNKNTSFFIDQNMEARKSNYLGRQSKMIDLLKNIEGKVIKSPLTEKIDRSSREVQFKKSSAKEQDYVISVTSTNNQTTFQKIEGRKSCLKRPSFEGPLVVTSGPRRSKFQALHKGQVDGHIVRNHRKSIQSNNSGKYEQDSDEGSEHNIFGSKQMVLSNELRKNLGMGDEEEKDEIIIVKEPKQRSAGGKSILKKNSSFVMMITPSKVCSKENIKSRDGSEDGRKKKSVMFSRTQ